MYMYVLVDGWITSPGFEKAGSDFDFKNTWVPWSSLGFGKKRLCYVPILHTPGNRNPGFLY